VLEWFCSLRSGKTPCNLLAKSLSKVNDQSGYQKVIEMCTSCERSTKRDLPTTPPDTPRSAAASHVNLRRSTYALHHQTHQDQLQPRTSIFAGQLTNYTTRHTKISCSLASPSSQVNLLPTPPDTLRSAAASHVNLRRSTYQLHHQTHQD
jgi:hypothetical protein